MIGPRIPERFGQVGFVEVYLTLNPDGSIQDPTISVEQPEGLGLGQIALAGLSRCHLVPVVKDGVAVPVTKHLRLTFGFE